MLGTPIGSELHVSQKMDQRMAKERTLWEAIPTVPDLQCAWQILLQSGHPRANHTMCTLPPSVSVEYCRAHDEGIWATVKALLDGIPAHEEEDSRQLATLPMRMGGLGLRSAVRCAPAAYWASWSDALHMISQRTPEVADDVVWRLSEEEPPEGCLVELRAAASELDRKGFWWRLSWPELHEGRRPLQTETRELGEWPHGWQCWASSVLDAFYRKNSMLTNRPASRQAHLRSHSGRNAGVVFAHAPTAAECTVPPHLFRVLLLERLQLPLPLTEATCNGCHELLDPLGRHRGACTRSGRVKKRATPTERMIARVCREAGARVKFNAHLRDMNLGVRGTDERRIEVLAQDLSCFENPAGNRHHLAECSLCFWGGPTWSCGGGWGSACPGSPREVGQLPGVVDLEAMPTCCGRDRDRRAMERRGGATSLAVRTG